jgi:hypothetical protein
MSADWYYMKRRWIGGSSKVGPISEHDLLLLVDRAEITPETLLCSEKTKNHWVKMEQVGPALKRWRAQHPVVDAT